MPTRFDIVTVGGGLGGSSVAAVMAKCGARVLVLEQEERFRDRVRGEYVQPWGVEEAHRLGLWQTLLSNGALELTWWDVYGDKAQLTHRNFPETTAVKRPGGAFSHPVAQEALITLAEQAGAEVVRGARVTAIDVENRRVEYAAAGRSESVYARLIVGADGRNSRIRTWAGFTQRSNPEFLLIAGVLLDGVDMEVGSAHIWDAPGPGLRALFFPLGKGRARAYLCWHESGYPRLSGSRDITAFVEKCVQTGVPSHAIRDARQAGPLATFSGADSWVEHVAKNGVVLIGDSAATSDPVWGHGISMTLRDARVLRDCLADGDDWDATSNVYAREHARYYECLHTYESWVGLVSFPSSYEEVALAEKAAAAQQADPSRRPDLQGSGPDFTLDEAAKRRFFGDD